ncbi:MAG: DNA-directed RNA polymerase subunit D [Candidatus Omnitrophica bacterium]|nr:DNA-directed RNA polymerase subunit D [Candidatus Omnitrophota bacterium]
MKVKLLNKKTDFVEFEIKNTNTGFVNALRRTMLNKVPTLAIELMDVVKNSSALYNDILAHRLSLIPLTFDFKDNVENYQVKFVLEKKGPCTVYAKDLKSTDKKVKSCYPDIVIVKLLENQEIKLEATALFGKGKEHAKWIPAKVGYMYYPDSKTLKEHGMDKGDIAEYEKKALEVKGDETRIIVNVVSISGQKPENIVLNAVEILQKELKELENKVKQEKSGTKKPKVAKTVKKPKSKDKKK